MICDDSLVKPLMNIFNFYFLKSSPAIGKRKLYSSDSQKKERKGLPKTIDLFSSANISKIYEKCMIHLMDPI